MILEPYPVRAAIEIGMGGPKLLVAEVDPQTNKIIRVLRTQKYFIDFYRDISESPDHQLSGEAMAQGLTAFRNAIERAKGFQVEGIVAIATEALRSAANGEQFAAEIQTVTGIPVYILDQNLEGKLAFQAVLANMDMSGQDLVVWDVGGGSMQWTTLAPDGSYLVSCGRKGSGAFRDFIIRQIQHQNGEVGTPNPMSAEDILGAEAHVADLSREIDRIFHEKLRNPATAVVGVGSVFGYGIRSTIGNRDLFGREELRQIVQAFMGKSDEDVGGGEFASVEVSNAIFVHGFMQNLDIQRVRIVNVNNSDGAILYEPFWEMVDLKR